MKIWKRRWGKYASKLAWSGVIGMVASDYIKFIETIEEKGKRRNKEESLRRRAC